MKRRLVAALAAFCVLAAAPDMTSAAEPPTWDDLVKVKSKKLYAVYLLPGADFRGYTKVKLDPTEVAFRKGWLRSYNSSTMGLGSRISDADAQKIADEARTGFDEIFAKTYADAGYQIVTEPGPGVLRLSTAVINLSIAAPDRPTAGRSYTFSVDAGEATVVIEARDSTTGAVLGRAIDRRTAGDAGGGMRGSLRTSISNRADFERMFHAWAKASVDGLAQLKAMSPVDTAGQPPRK